VPAGYMKNWDMKKQGWLNSGKGIFTVSKKVYKAWYIESAWVRLQKL
jgi:hypothetical protein